MAVDFEAIRQKVLAIASQKTGYPVEMLDPELDLEADLGIDTVKQAEMFAEIRAAFGIPRPEGLKLSDYNTLAKVMDFARQRVFAAPAPAAPAAPAPSARPESVTAPAPAAASAAQEPSAPELLRADPVRFLSGNAEQTRMCVPVLALRPAARDCRPTGFAPAGRFLLVGEPRHTMELARSIRARGGQAEELDLPPDREAAGETLARTIESSRPDGIFWLASCADPVLPGGDSPLAWQRALDLRARLLFRAAKSFDGMRGGRKTCLIAATRMGGRLGLDGANPDPAAGATAGLVKSLAREWPETLCKAVDFAASTSATEMAEALLEELERDPAVVEVGRLGEERLCPTLAELGPSDPAQTQPGLPQQPVVLLTGGAGDIVGAVAIDLARNFRGAFYLCDRVPAAEPGDADVGLLRSDREALKRELVRRLSQDGARVTPMQVERALRQIERQSVALATMEAIRQAGAEAHYISADVTDEAALAEAVAGIRQRHGRLDLVVHAAGLEHSQLVARKSAEDFDRIFGVKADGLNALLSACGADSPALVMFGSVAGRFGNLGQTDYAAANDLLARCAWALPRLRGLRALTLAFSGWEGVGMATRGSIPEQLKAAGVDLIPLSEGQASVRRALALGGSGEVIVARSLGRMLDGLRQPGVELAPIRNRLQNAPQRFPLLGQVRDWTVADGLMVEVTFDPRREPYLDHHRIEGTAVLPGVMAVEAFAEAVSLLCPEQQVVTVEDLCFMAPLKLYRDEPRSAMLRLLPLSGPQGREWLAVMETWRELVGGRPQHTLHFHARLKLDRQKPVARHRRRGAVGLETEAPRERHRATDFRPALGRGGEAERAEPLLRQAAAQADSEADARYYLGLALDVQGRSAEAVEQFLLVCDLDREQPDPVWAYSAEDFEALLRATLAGLPPELAEPMSRVPFRVLPHPPLELVAEGLDPRAMLYLAGARPEPPEAAEMSRAPAPIVCGFVYKRPLERLAGSGAGIAVELRAALEEEARAVLCAAASGTGEVGGG
jgi:NAD(P)-dependent dehydrogenase (short-subunit alcohol dehydrogenase family)/acyl carrier protein